MAGGAVELAPLGVAAAQLHIVAPCPIHRDFQLLRGAGQLHRNPALCVFIRSVADGGFEDRAVAVRAEHRAFHRKLCRQRLAIPGGAIGLDRYQLHRHRAADRGQQRFRADTAIHRSGVHGLLLHAAHAQLVAVGHRSGGHHMQSSGLVRLRQREVHTPPPGIVQRAAL